MNRPSCEFSNSRRYDRPLSCLLLDMDHFKSVNDGHGHLVGDAVLRHTAQLLSRQLRRGDVLARYGGEEFVLLLPGTPAATALPLAESLRSSVAQAPWVQGDLSLPLTLSIGVTDNRAGLCADETALLRQADEALYAAKRQGRNRVVVYAGPGD